jgi:hypothetical protein
LDSSGGQYRPPKPVEVAQMVATIAAVAESRGPNTVLGYEWGRESSGWQRSQFTRTSEPYQNDRRKECHIAVGLGCRYDDRTYTWLKEQARALMIDGALIFAPFVRVNPRAASVDEALMKAHAVGAALTNGSHVEIERGGDMIDIFAAVIPGC